MYKNIVPSIIFKAITIQFHKDNTFQDKGEPMNISLFLGHVFFLCKYCFVYY